MSDLGFMSEEREKMNRGFQKQSFRFGKVMSKALS
jgi:hypothetical protein